jgi:ketosteroid isomerase-like protein
MLTDERSARFHRVIEAWTKQNLAAIDEVMAPDVVYHMPPFPDFSGTEPLRRFIANFRRAFPDDFQVTIEEELAAGDTTVHRWSVGGTYSVYRTRLSGQ